MIFFSIHLRVPLLSILQLKMTSGFFFPARFYCKRWFLIGENVIISTIFLPLQIARKYIADYIDGARCVY